MVEILVGLGIVVLLAVALQSAFDRSRSKAQSLLEQIQTLSEASERFKADTGCYPIQASILFDESRASFASNNSCAKGIQNTWNGPYLKPVSVASVGSGILSLDGIADGTHLRISSAAGPYGTRYVAWVSFLPGDIALNFLSECNGVSSGTGTQYGPISGLVGHKCGAASQITPGSSNHTVWRIMAETR